MGGLCVPVFTYGQPSVFFKQFSRYAKVAKLSSQECFDTMCFCMGACSQGQWLADLIEREVAPEGDVAAVIAAVQARVQSALQPEVLKSAIMADVEKASLKPGQSPRELAELLRNQISTLFPEMTAESTERMVTWNLVKAAPEAWKPKLMCEDQKVDTIVHKMTVLQLSEQQQVQTARRCAVTTRKPKCYQCGKLGHLARDCVKRSASDVVCSKCTLRGHPSSSCRTKCRKCHQVGHIQVNCSSGSTQQRRVVVGKSLLLEVMLNGVKVKGVIDSGAEQTVVSEQMAREAQLKVQPSDRLIKGISGGPNRVRGVAQMDIEVEGNVVNLETLVSEIQEPVLLGNDFLRAAEVTVNFSKGLVTAWGREVPQTMSTVCRCVVEDTFQEPEEFFLQEELMCPPHADPKEQAGNTDFNLEHLGPAEQKEMRQQLEKYDVFSKDGVLGSVTAVEHRVVLKEEPKRKKPYPVPPALRPVVAEQVEEMLEKGVIRECSSPYASPVLLVRKKGELDGAKGYRFCTDFRELNRCTVKDSFPLPRMETLPASVGPKSRVFSQLDQTAAYWQVKLEKESQEKTAFVTEQGQFCYQTLAFGMCNGPATYQRLMSKVLKDLLFRSVVVYLDDVLVFTETMQQHVEVLGEVCRRLEQSGIRLNPRKCRFAQREVTFLSHVISADGIRPAESNVAAIEQYRRPSNKTEVLRFLGMAGFFRHLIPNFSARSAALTDLTSQERFEWTAAAEESFQDLKGAVAAYPVVQPADTELPFRVTTDACGRGWGATLTQGTDADEHVVAYASGKWTGAQSRYHTTEQELLAVIRAVHRFRYYLLGTRFTVITDHQALKWLWALEEPTGRLARWIMYLTQFDMCVEHRKGTLIPHADALSRDVGADDVGQEENVSAVRATDVLSADDQSQAGTAAAVDGSAAASQPTAQQATAAGPSQATGERPVVDSEAVDSLRQATAKDPILGEVIRCLESGAESSVDDAEVKFYLSGTRREYLTVRDGVLLHHRIDERDPLIIVPSSLRSALLSLAHNCPLAGHFGVARTLANLTCRYYWFNMKLDVRRHCRECEGCARVKRPARASKEGIFSVPVVGEPFMQLSADVLGPLPCTREGNRFILVVSDLFTKWVEVFSMKDQQATTIADCILEVIARFSVPKSLLTDKGTNFESALIKHICERLGIKKLRCTSQHPQTDGQTERYNRTLCDCLTQYVNANQSDWDKWLSIVTSAYRTSVHSSTGFSPYELVFGVPPRTPVVSEFDDYDQLTSVTYADYARGVGKRLVEDRARAARNIRAGQEKSSVPSTSDFSVGDCVMLKVHSVPRGKSKKLCARFSGPYRIESVHRPDYVIRSGRQKKRVHGSNLKRVDSSLYRVPPRVSQPEPAPPQRAGGEAAPPQRAGSEAAPIASVIVDSSVLAPVSEQAEGEPTPDVCSEADPVVLDVPDPEVELPRTRSGRVVRPRKRLDL